MPPPRRRVRRRRWRRVFTFFTCCASQVIEVAPSQTPYLWQRGLSLYYADRFQDGADQFRRDVAVNPNDTEEAIWAFLCEVGSPAADWLRNTLVALPGGRSGRAGPYVQYTTTIHATTTHACQHRASATATALRRREGRCKSQVGRGGFAGATTWGGGGAGAHAAGGQRSAAGDASGVRALFGSCRCRTGARSSRGAAPRW